MRLRATCNLIFDYDSDLPYNEAVGLARKHLDSIKFDNNIEDLRIVLQVDKLKEKVDRIKLGEFSFDDFFPFVTNEKIKKEYEIGDCKYAVKMNSDRYLLFKQNSSCVSCGLQGNKLFLECYQNDRIPHFNLYGELEGKLILFTKDHIQAKAFGGQDTLENYQTMCALCNSLKAHSNLTLESLRKLRQIYDENKKVLTKKKLHFLIENERKNLEMPWSSQVVEGQNNGSFIVNCDVVIVEQDKLLIGMPLEQVNDAKILGFVKKGSCFDPLVEINNTICFQMSADKVFSVDKSFVQKNK